MDASTTDTMARDTDTAAALFGGGAIFAVSLLAGFPTGFLLVGPNARRLGRMREARALTAAAVVGFAVGAAIAALQGRVFLITYPIQFLFELTFFIPLNLLLGLALAFLAHRDAARAEAVGATLARRPGRIALGIGALALLATFLVGVVVVVLAPLV